MITMNDLVDLRMQQQIAHEILYRQQIMQRIPDPFAGILSPSLQLSPHMLIPQHAPLPGAVQAKLENNELWQQFHKIGTEMIITKSGRRMFPSMRVSLKGLEDETQYCILIEMVPIGDCRFKYSGSQWIPAGGAEPQSPQRMYLHPDSPASGSHWQAQPILFNKVKLTNNTLDNSGHVVLASMHKYQPRIHVINTNDLTQIPWAPQKAFVFPETEFIAVTAYQNDRITKLKIDNNPFAKGFRETGQSKCKRKMSLSPSPTEELQLHCAGAGDDDQASVTSSQDSPQNKRLCMNEESLPYRHLNNVMRHASISEIRTPAGFLPHLQPMFVQTLPAYMESIPLPSINYSYHSNLRDYEYISCNEETASQVSSLAPEDQHTDLFVDVVSTTTEDSRESEQFLNSCNTPATTPLSSSSSSALISCEEPVKRTSFSISSILNGNSGKVVSA